MLRYLALACDYDGTLTADGRLAPVTEAVLERARRSGRRVILVTGREFDDLLRVCHRLDLFDRVVAENGGVLFTPSTRQVRSLAEPPPEPLIAMLQRRGVPCSAGRAILSTRQPFETLALEAIRELGLEWHVVFNKGAVMILPPGVTKASGLVEALRELGLSPHNVVGVGDAENDHAFLTLCECAAAVANALPMLKRHADIVLTGLAADGAIELIDELIRDDLRAVSQTIHRHAIPLGIDPQGQPVNLQPSGDIVLLAGASGSGKSTLVMGLLERLAERRYQFCVIDPEGDYEGFAEALVLGTTERPPAMEEIVRALEQYEQHVVINLLGVPPADRPAWFTALLPSITELRVRTGRPHWLIIDEAHHVLPAASGLAATSPPDLGTCLMVTVRPDMLSRSALEPVTVGLTVGETARQSLAQLTEALRAPHAVLPADALAPGEALLWRRATAPETVRFHVAPSVVDRRRHQRKYAQGDVGEERSFFFRGPAGALNLRAQNLMVFAQLANGIDDETWLFHLRRHDYSRWFATVIKDDELARMAARIENANISAEDSRREITRLINERYTLPAVTGSSPRDPNGTARVSPARPRLNAPRAVIGPQRSQATASNRAHPPG